MFLPNVPTCAYCETRGQTLSGSTCRVGKTYVLHKPSSHESSTPYSNLFRISELEVLNWSLKMPGQDIMYIISIFTKLINQPQIPQIIASDTNINPPFLLLIFPWPMRIIHAPANLNEFIGFSVLKYVTSFDNSKVFLCTICNQYEPLD